MRRLRSAGVATRASSTTAAVDAAASGSRSARLPPPPSAADVSAFHERLELQGVPARATQLMMLQAASASHIREVESLSTLSRQMAFMLLVKDPVTNADLMNPASASMRNPNVGSEGDSGGSGGGGGSSASASAELALAENLPGGGGAGAGGDASSLLDEAEAQRAFGVGATAPMRGSAAAAAARAGAIPTPTVSPRIGGVLSHISAGSLAPYSAAISNGAPFVPNPAGLRYLDALRDFLRDSVLPRIARRVASNATFEAEAAAGVKIDAASGLDLLTARAAIAVLVQPSVAGSAAPALPAALEAWLAQLTGAQLAAFSQRYAAASLGGKTAVARSRAIMSALSVLDAAREGRLNVDAGANGSSSSGGVGGAETTSVPLLPRVTELHAALLAAVGGTRTGIAGFTDSLSAAAAHCTALCSAVESMQSGLNSVPPHTLRIKSAAELAGRGEGSGGSGVVGASASPALVGASAAAAADLTFSIHTPTVSQLLASPGLELEAPLSLKEVPSGRIFPLAVGPLGGTHSLRLLAGHVPAMLSPLMRVLTPAEWAAALTIVRVMLPTLSPYLLHAVTASSLPLSPQGSSASSAVSKRTSSFSIADSAADIGGAYAIVTKDKARRYFINPTGVPISTLNALQPVLEEDAIANANASKGSGDGGSGAEGGSGEVDLMGDGPLPDPATVDLGGGRIHEEVVAAIRSAAETAPDNESRSAYLGYVIDLRMSRVLHTTQRLSEAHIAANIDKLEASAGGDPARLEGVAVLRKRTAEHLAALSRGERVMEEAELLALMRRAEAAMSPTDRRAMGPSIANEMATMLKHASGATGLGDVGTGVEEFSSAARLMAPAIDGPIAAIRQTGPGEESCLGRIDWGAGMVGRKGLAGRLRLDGAAGRGGRVYAHALANMPAMGGGVVGDGGPSQPLVTRLGEEDCGGILDRARASSAHADLEDGVWPPLPRIGSFDLHWAARRVLEGFPPSTDCGLSARNAYMLTPIAPTPRALRRLGGHHTDAEEGDGVAGEGSDYSWEGGEDGGGGGEGGNSTPLAAARRASALAAVDFAIADVPKHVVNAGALPRRGIAGITAPPDTARAGRLLAAEGALAAAEAEKAAEDAGEAPPPADAPWDKFSYCADEDYRSEGAYTIVHERMLEASAAHDLGAVWALWLEYCRLSPQEGSPDFLALEIVMDAAARARRHDLVLHVLWPRAAAWRLEPTPTMLFILLKAAALAEDHKLALSIFNTLRKQAPLDARHHAAVVSACAAAGAWKEAFATFNLMKSARLTIPTSLFSTLFERLGAAGRKEDCHYVWRALAEGFTAATPAALYTQIIELFASQGNIEDMDAAIARMSRKVDGNLAPSLRACTSAFGAYVTAGLLDKARAMVERMDSLNYLSDDSPNGLTRGAFEGVLNDAEGEEGAEAVGTLHTATSGSGSGSSGTLAELLTVSAGGSTSPLRVRAAVADASALLGVGGSSGGGKQGGASGGGGGGVTTPTLLPVEETLLEVEAEEDSAFFDRASLHTGGGKGFKDAARPKGSAGAAAQGRGRK